MILEETGKVFNDRIRQKRKAALKKVPFVTNVEELKLLLWVALEALFASANSTTETTYRLSQRLAFFVGADRAVARDLTAKVRSGYAWRSRIAHGMRLKKLEKQQSATLMHETEGLIRAGLTKVLGSGEYVSTFSNEAKRDSFLDDLVFSA